MADAYASGDWKATPGREQEFTSRWQEWLDWTRDNFADGFEGAMLLRDEGDPSHFLSVGEWSSTDGRDAWGRDPEFMRQYERCSELCTEVKSAPYAEAVRLR